MQYLHTHRSAVFLALVAIAAVVTPPETAKAQAKPPIIFLLPRPEIRTDSGYTVALAHEVRRRMESRFRHKYRIVKTEEIAKFLEESGYHPDVPLAAEDAARLAQAMRAGAYILGTFVHREATPTARFRFVDLQRAGLSGWQSIRGTAGDPPRAFAETVVDSMRTQVRAAEYAMNCIDRRDRSDYRKAREEAGKAFELYPSHPSSAMCLEIVFEGMQQPVDSMVWALELAVQGDSLLSRGWERLGRLHQQAGDSLKALDAFTRQLMTTPSNRNLRRGIIAGSITLRQYDRAVDLADEWLGEHPDDREFLQLKARACVQGEMWACALSGLTEQYDLNPDLVGDTVFYRQVIGAAQGMIDGAERQIDSITAVASADDPGIAVAGAVRDTGLAVLVEWTGEAVRQVPTSLALWHAHTNALTTAEMTDSLLVIHRRLMEIDPTDLRNPLAVARILISGVTIDTLTPLDTARLNEARALLDRVTAGTQDTSFLMNAAVLYFQPGLAIIQGQLRDHFSYAVEWLEQAIEYDVLNRLQQQASFFVGFVLMFEIYAFDQQVTESRSCRLVDEEARMIARGKAAMQVGAALAPDRGQQLLDQFNQFEARIPQLREAFECQ